MAVDKLVDSSQLDTDLAAVANAIRAKSGGSASLAFPGGFVSAVQAIPTGITPTGTKQISITENGTVTEDVTNYASAEITVDVQSGGGIEDEIIQKTISGSYTNSNVTKIEQSVFYLCTGLTAVSFPNVTSVAYRGFSGCSNLVSAYLPRLTSLGNEVFDNCSSLEIVDIPNLSRISSNAFSRSKIPAAFWPGIIAGLNSFLNCKSLATAVVGTTDYSQTFKGCTALTGTDLTNNSGKIVPYCFSDDALLSTLVIRGTGIYKLENISAFSGTPFASGGSGGTVYIKKALYDHLGDGSSLDYKAATNWSTVDGYGTITWAQIEGSQYENYYVDGTPIAA